MKIKWLGHSCFLLTSGTGTRVITDPFDEKVGYRLPDEEADVVTVSHGHYDHNYTEAVRGSFTLVNKPGMYDIGGVAISGVPTYHDEKKGALRGSNIIFTFKIDGMRVCHCGDLGHIPEPDTIKSIGKVDILLLPVGGVYTVDAEGAAEVMSKLRPRVTIPMHYKTRVLKFKLNGIDDFINAAGGGERLDKQEIELEKEDLTKYPSIVILNY